MSEPIIAAGVHIRLVLTMTFWGGTFVAGRLLAEELFAFFETPWDFSGSMMV